jgi:uridine monophosphate synthetase
METFFSFLSKRVDDCSSLLCVGLDPHPSDLPAPTGEAAREFCLRIIKATAPFAAAFKPNAAFFELYGPEGWVALKDIISAVQDESNRLGSLIPVILDAKRGDIASTAEAYARSAFEHLGAHAITLNPYLGKDSVDPFLAYKEKGVFLLCKTSNPGAGDLQEMIVDRETTIPEIPSSAPGRTSVPLFEHIALLAQTWNSGDNIGLVVGATQPEALARIRQVTPNMWYLVPGIGTQGGDLETALRAGLREDGKGLLVNISRGISRADNPATAAAQLRDEIVNIQYRLTSEKRTAGGKTSAAPAAFASLADNLLSTGCVKFGEFTLKSGMKSPIYIDLRQIISHPQLLDQIGVAYLSLLKGLTFDRIAGLPYAALPIATSVSLRGGYPMIYPRKEVKEYGTKAVIEGEFHPGETAIVLDDLATTGGSKFEAIEKLTAAGLKVRDVVVLIDRQSGAKEALEQAGFRLHAVLTITQMLDHWEKTGKVEQGKIEETRAFLQDGM